MFHVVCISSYFFLEFQDTVMQQHPSLPPPNTQLALPSSTTEIVSNQLVPVSQGNIN